MLLFKWLKLIITNTKKTDDFFNEILVKSKNEFDHKWMKQEKSYTAQLSDFELIKDVGKGKYGRVVYARIIKNTETSLDEYVSIKIMLKRVVANDNATLHIIQEKKILQTVKCPFIVEYKGHFKDFSNLYLVTEFLPGGDIYHHLKKKEAFEENVVLFYVAQVVLCFEYLHYIGIIFRDLKPENVAIDQNGYLKLLDFGLAKKIDNNKTRSLCGTPEYVAPEIIRHEPYSYSVDWWALGIFTYELLHGKTPFRSQNVMQTLNRIIKSEVNYYKKFDRQEVTIGFMRNLLQTNVKNRLRCGVTIRNHEYFQNIEWLSIYQKIMLAPYKPSLFTDPPQSIHDQQIDIEESEVELYTEEFKDF